MPQTKMEQQYNKEKANWDARVDYSQLLRRSIEYINYSIAMNDIQGWFSGIESLINLSERSIGKDKDVFRQRVRKLRKWYNMKKNNPGCFTGALGDQYYEIDKLNDLTGELIRSVSDLLLPFKSDEDPSDIDDIIEREVGKL